MRLGLTLQCVGESDHPALVQGGSVQGADRRIVKDVVETNRFDSKAYHLVWKTWPQEVVESDVHSSSMQMEQIGTS